LRERKLIDPIHAAIDSGKPFLGICLGLQLLFDRSYEHGEHRGLGIVPGEVLPFRLPAEFKVPHMGWNQLQFRQRSALLEGLDEGVYCYFVHSYYVRPEQAEVAAAETDYGGLFCSMICRGNLFATQFHPEKSQADGLRILQNFAELEPVNS